MKLSRSEYLLRYEILNYLDRVEEIVIGLLRWVFIFLGALWLWGWVN